MQSILFNEGNEETTSTKQEIVEDIQHFLFLAAIWILSVRDKAKTDLLTTQHLPPILLYGLALASGIPRKM